LTRFWQDWTTFCDKGGEASFTDISPCLLDRESSTQSGGGHYFYQDVWALRALAAIAPKQHHDIGSRLDGFVAQATAICPIAYWDIRPPCFTIPNFTFRAGNILDMPVPDNSIDSLSCLHVAEHIGLGRYGDPIEAEGTNKALLELQRILAVGGTLLFSMPVGRERVEFNAQRIWAPDKPPTIMSRLRLMEFSAITDAGEFVTDIRPADVAGSRYACGLYRFRKD
jgi:SAM-dependent methyltransferase